MKKKKKYHRWNNFFPLFGEGGGKNRIFQIVVTKKGKEDREKKILKEKIRYKKSRCDYKKV